MTYTEFKRHLGKAGLSINEFAALLHLRPNSVSNYAKKDAVPHTHAVIAVSLGVDADRGVDFREMLGRYGVRFQRQGRTSSEIVQPLSDYRGMPSLREGK